MASTYNDGDVRSEGFGVHDEEENFDEAQGGFDDLSGVRREEEAHVVQQLLHGRRGDGVWEHRNIPSFPKQQ